MQTLIDGRCHIVLIFLLFMLRVPNFRQDFKVVRIFLKFSILLTK